jgi:hypothetical protein
MFFSTLDLGPVDVFFKGDGTIDSGLETPGSLINVGLLIVLELQISRVSQRLDPGGSGHCAMSSTGETT